MNKDLPRIKTDIKDIVCGMEVSSHSQYHHHYGNNRYYFCSESCRGKFIDNPERYLAKRISIPKEESEEPIVYTCPMHPEVRQSSPGSCPKCGMALDPIQSRRRKKTPNLSA